MNKKDLLIKAYQLKNQGYNKSEVCNILKSIDLNNYKTDIYNNPNKVKELYAPNLNIKYDNYDNYDYLRYIIDKFKERFSKLDRNIKTLNELINSILENYYLDYDKFLLLQTFTISFDKVTKKISISIYIRDTTTSKDVSINTYNRNGIIINVNSYSKQSRYKMSYHYDEDVKNLENSDNFYLYVNLYSINNFKGR